MRARTVRRDNDDTGGETVDRPEIDRDDDSPIRCAQCGASLTREAHRIRIANRHAHTCINPADVRFRVLCFGAAEGVRDEGAPTRFYSWFEGYAWSMAHCATCQVHVGWRFDGEAAEPSSFYGLIAERLRSAKR